MNIDSRENETIDVFVKVYEDLLNSAQSKFNTFSAKRLSSKPTRLAIFLYLLGAVSTVLFIIMLISMDANGISVFYIVSVTGILVLLMATYILLRKEKVSRLKRYRRGRAKALFYEPENLWGTLHPQSGERGRLIKALLGARHIARTIEETTTVPLSGEVMDTVISHLIQGISAAKEDDIHEHYIKETLHLCQGIHEYYSRYYPIIELQQLLRYGENK
jgi:hypothetical protein